MFKISGRVVREPKMITAKDHKVYLFTVAVPRTFKNRAGEIETDFVSLQSSYIGDPNKKTVYDLLGKGDIVDVEGDIRSYETEKDGEKIYGQNLVVSSVKRLFKAAPAAPVAPIEVATADGDVTTVAAAEAEA